MSLRTRLIRCGLANALLVGISFLCAGGFTQPALRRYLLGFAIWDLVSTLVMSPALASERSRPRGQGIDPAVRPVACLLLVATVASGAFDVGRIHSTLAFPQGVSVGAMTVFVASSALQTWAMAVNAFFSTEVRIQVESGHRVVREGPYRYIRHPGYLAMLAIAPSTALAIGSVLALIPAILYDVLILIRAAREDSFLVMNLPGYADYIHGAPYRLIPGIW